MFFDYQHAFGKLLRNLAQMNSIGIVRHELQD